MTAAALILAVGGWGLAAAPGGDLPAPSAPGPWKPIEIYGGGLQTALGRKWKCYPAWEVTVVHTRPDATITTNRYSTRRRKWYTRTRPFFLDRHIDKRFRISYPRPTRDGPRVVGLVIGNPKAEWDAVIRTRDRYLADAGLTTESPPEAVARCLAESFRKETYFDKKPDAPFAEAPRQTNGPVEGLLYKSWCTGCAKGFAAMAATCGLAVRTIGIGRHYVAEVRVDGRWRLVDNGGRRRAGARMFYRTSWADAWTDLAGHRFFVGRYHGQYDFPDGTWGSPKTLRFAPSNAHAIYPRRTRWAFSTGDGKRLKLIDRVGGFYWPITHPASQRQAMAKLLSGQFPGQKKVEGLSRAYLYFPFKPGQAVRQSVYLGRLSPEDTEAVEVTLTFGDSTRSEFSEATWKSLELSVGDFRRSLHDLGVREASPSIAGSANCQVRVTLPLAALAAGEVNWITLHHKGDTILYVPCCPSVMEPYLNPLGPAG
ncbi:MAG: hypothetical protein ACYS5V_03580 [Planctomycetota bacterium]|jgi:hypothetical protein